MVASPSFAGDAHLRHDGGDLPSRQSSGAEKNGPPNHGKNKTIATSSLTAWSIQEVLVTLAQSSSGGRSARALQHKKATVTLGSIWVRSKIKESPRRASNKCGLNLGGFYSRLNSCRIRCIDNGRSGIPVLAMGAGGRQSSGLCVRTTRKGNKVPTDIY